MIVISKRKEFVVEVLYRFCSTETTHLLLTDPPLCLTLFLVFLSLSRTLSLRKVLKYSLSCVSEILTLGLLSIKSNRGLSSLRWNKS